MKLLVKTNLYTLAVTILLFSIGAFVIYEAIIFKFDSETDAHLLAERNRVAGDLSKGVPPSDIFAKNDTRNYIHEVKTRTVFSDRYGLETEKESYIEEEDEDEEQITYKSLLFQAPVGKKTYEVKITSSLSEGQEMRSYITVLVVILLGISTLILLLLNHLISGYIWRPFHSTIRSLKLWNMQQRLPLGHTDIYEFSVLNASLLELTEKIKLDYINLKEFTENVSHETQTPLAILNNKLELLLQENNYSPAQFRLLQESYTAVQRLYKLNKTLIMLSRIENGQFLERQLVQLDAYLDEKIREFEDFTEVKGIRIEKKALNDIAVVINPTLINVLFDNLFLNAIKYNTERQGTILLNIEGQTVTIENTSFIPGLDTKFLFERVAKNSTSGSLGIGLSLISKITEFYGWHLQYRFSNNRHAFRIHFKGGE